MAIGLVVGILLGLLTYAVMASLRNASQLAKLIATLGLFSAGQAFMILRWGLGIVQPKPMLPSRIVTLWGDVTIGLDRLLLIGIALAVRGGPQARLLADVVRAGDVGRGREPSAWRPAPGGHRTASSR